MKTIITLSILLFTIAGITTLYTVTTSDIGNMDQIESIHGHTVELYNKGVYKLDSKSLALQGIAQDTLNLVLIIPISIVCLIFYIRKSVKARLLLTGCFGYFAYTYTSYSFLFQYNHLFLVYNLLMGLSIFGTILLLTDKSNASIENNFSSKTPVTFIGVSQLIFSALFLFLWLDRIIPSLSGDYSNLHLEHYTTLVIQAMDLGILLPATVIAGITIMLKKPIAYLLSSVLLFKFAALFSSIVAMAAIQYWNGIEQDISLFVILALWVYVLIFLLLKNIRSNPY